MRSVMLVAMLIPLLLLAGCAKPVAKKRPAASDETANVKTKSPAQPVNDKKEEPNWLTDPRFKKEKDKSDEPTDAKGPSGKQSWIATPPVTDKPSDKPVTGVLQPVPEPKAPTSPTSATAPELKLQAVSRQDMFDLQVFIHDSSLVMGQMPPPVMIYKALVESGTPTAKLVKDGSITLTGATRRESIWAYETKALWNGGFIVGPNGVDTVTAEQLKAALKQVK